MVCAPHMVVTPEQKAKAGKHATKNGTINAIHHFQPPCLPVN